MSKGVRGQPLEEKIPIGALVSVSIDQRINEYAVIVDYNYGYYENSWYLVHGLSSRKEYMAYPEEVTWLTKGLIDSLDIDNSNGGKPE